MHSWFVALVSLHSGLASVLAFGNPSIVVGKGRAQTSSSYGLSHGPAPFFPSPSIRLAEGRSRRQNNIDEISVSASRTESIKETAVETTEAYLKSRQDTFGTRCHDADRLFAIAEALHLRRHRWPKARILAMYLFRRSLWLRTDWRHADARLSVDSGINNLFMTFSDLSSDDIATVTLDGVMSEHVAADESSLDAVKTLRIMLDEAGYTSANVQDRFGGFLGRFRDQRLPGPYYLRKTLNHSQGGFIASLGPPQDNLDVLIRLFLLGLGVERADVERLLTIERLASIEPIGLLGECTVDPTLTVSLVQIFPLDAEALACASSCRLRSTAEPAGLGDELRHDTGEGGVTNTIASPSSLLFATDWPPPGTLALREEPVMYIGPDSIGLVQHAPRTIPRGAISSDYPGDSVTSVGQRNPGRHVEDILDLCCGSGVQGIAAVALRRGKARVTCVDVNPRAVRFSRFNAALNGLDASQFTARIGDAYDGIDLASRGNREWPPKSPEITSGYSMRSVDKNNNSTSDGLYDLILANPPFVPVPPRLDFARKRYDMFASGGPSGEAILEKIFRGALPRLRPGGTVAVVSELVNPEMYPEKLRRWIGQSPRVNMGKSKVCPTPHPSSDDASDKILFSARRVSRRRGSWSKGRKLVASRSYSPHPWTGIVLHEKRSWSSKEYASRRAGSRGEVEGWTQHMARMGIEEMANGFIFVRCFDSNEAEHPDSGTANLDAGEREISMEGILKLWAPHNVDALNSSKAALRRLGLIEHAYHS